MPKPKTVSKKKAKRESNEEVDFSPKQSLLELKFKDKKFNLTEKQQIILKTALSPEIKIVFLSGPAGSSKTWCAIYAALNIINRDKDKGICYVRSVVESASSHMGFLPGTEDDKINPYMRPLKDKLSEILKADSVSNLDSAELLETRPINFLRGNQFDNQIVVLDEAQNLTKREMVTFLTRIGKNCIMFVCGDSDQSDIREKDAFFETISAFGRHEKSKDFGIYHFAFTIDDVVRNPIIKHILRVMS